MLIIGYILAALIGISLGLIGGGGSILTVPILVYIMGVDPVLATSYSLFIVGTTSLFGTITNYKKKQVNFKIAMLFGAVSITTVFLTRKFLVPQIPASLFSIGNVNVTKQMGTMILFALLMLLASFAMIKKKKEVSIDTIKNNEGNNIKLLLYAVGIGLVTGLLGAGGGFLLIPVLVLLVKMPMKMAVGTSLFIIALNSLIGFSGDLGHFMIDWKFLLTFTSIAIAGIFIGTALSARIAGESLKKTFGWFVLSMSIYILIKELFFHAATV